jgi:anhydro-N-acetylmuramic acid kinase
LDDYYLGLMSGTSVDSIDAAVLRFDPTPVIVLARNHALPEALRAELLGFAVGEYRGDPIDQLGRLDREFAMACADAASALLEALGPAAVRVRGIGSHGQTVRHRPPVSTLQIGDPNLIAARTGLPVVGDFRRMDLAFGGQGAPLVPAFHRAMFGVAGGARVIVNIGGIANLTLLTADGSVTGWDIGPGNTLLDAWHLQHRGAGMDRGGAWAAGHQPDQALLAALRSEPWFAAPPPKSTGRETFSLAWVQRHIGAFPHLDAGVVQSTLCQLSADTIAAAVAAGPAQDVVLCGGGVHNDELVRRLHRALPGHSIRSSAALGLDPDFVEAAAFAWLARERLEGRTGNLPAVTGASRAACLGGVYQP